MKNYYTKGERRTILNLSRRTIEEYLSSRRRVELDINNSKFEEKRGVFVTLHKKGELRGCIGYPLPIKPLKDAVIDNSISAAFEDPRFPPISSEEQDVIDIEVSVLTVPESVENPEEVIVGRDGIIVSKGFSRGLLLPQVPTEQGWNLEEYLSYGCMKAGLSPDEWRNPGIKIEIFRAEVFGEKQLNE